MKKFIVAVSLVIAVFTLGAAGFASISVDGCAQYASPEPPPPPPDGPNPPPPPPPTLPF